MKNTGQPQNAQGFSAQDKCLPDHQREPGVRLHYRLLLSILFLALVGGASAGACDFCNCVMGINPFYNGMNRIGFTFLYQHSHVTAGEALNPVAGSKPALFGYARLAHGGGGVDEHGLSVAEVERRMTFEFSYQHHLTSHIVVTALLPVTDVRSESTESIGVRGLGDATLLGHYAFTDLFSGQTSSTLLLGAGVELPSGSNTMRSNDGDLIDSRLQPGSGSLDVVANALLILPVHAWTFAVDTYGKLNGENGRNDRIGNSLSLTTSVSRDLYRNNPGNLAILGTIGLRGELSGQDRVAGTIDPASGAETVWGNLGGQLVVGHLKFNASALLPLVQNREPGGAHEDPRLTAGIRYEFE